MLFAQELLGLDATGFGLLASGAAAGGVVGSFLAARLSKRLGSGGNLLLSLVLGGLAWVVGLTSNAPLVWLMYVVMAFSVVLWNVITVSLRQAIIPDRLLGRVNSVYRFFGWGMMPIGIFIGGVVVEAVAGLAGLEVGLRAPFFLAAIVNLIL